MVCLEVSLGTRPRSIYRTSQFRSEKIIPWYLVPNWVRLQRPKRDLGTNTDYLRMARPSNLAATTLRLVEHTSWAGQEADNLSIGSYSDVFTSLGLKLGGSSHKAIGKPPTPENFPSESIWVKYWQNMANWRRSRGQSHCKID